MEIVRTAAKRLVADLGEAEQTSENWSNAAVGQSFVDDTLDRAIAALASTGLWGRENQLPSSEFWRIAGPLLERGSLHCRARFKPRGYAGDFETFVMFWRRFKCDDPLGRLFDDYFQRQTAVEAVRARIDRVAKAIVERAQRFPEKAYAIASIGCGPAIDLERAVEQLSGSQRENLSIQLFDLDEAALSHATERLGRILLPQQVTTRRENLYRLAQRHNAAQILRASDFLVCIGLFDYLPDPSAIKLLWRMWQQLKPGGTLIVGNFAPHNPTRAYMEWFGNWYLLYRTWEQLAELAYDAGIPREHVALDVEHTGVDLLLVATKPPV
ncbi:MAG: class I SAM-dependent methyltransferase [Pirellulales bacterium]|nr:class I SAM-dependent methyltransferase [Pirellulales bacterium]